MSANKERGADSWVDIAANKLQIVAVNIMQVMLPQAEIAESKQLPSLCQEQYYTDNYNTRYTIFTNQT